MKKLKKNQLQLDKEVITSLSENDLSLIKGGDVTTRPQISAKCGYSEENNACITIYHGDCVVVSDKEMTRCCYTQPVLECMVPITGGTCTCHIKL